MRSIKGTIIDTKGENIITELSRAIDEQKLYCVYQPTKSGMKMVFASVNKDNSIQYAINH